MIRKMKLKYVGTIITGNTPSKKNEEYYNSNDINFFTPTDFEVGKINDFKESVNYISNKAKEKARILPKGSVLVTCIGIIGKVGIAEKESAFNQQINAVIPNKDIIYNRYLAYWLISKAEILRKKANAAVVPIINKTNFQELEIEVPNMEIQKEIVKKLDRIQKIIEIRQKQMKELEELIESQFVERFDDPIFNDKSLKLVKLSDISELKAGKAINTGALESKYKEILYPCFGGNGLRGYINRYSNEGEYPIIGRQGALAGNVNLASGKFYATEHAIVVYPIVELNTLWYYYGLKMLNLLRFQTGAAQPGIAVENINKVEIPFPKLHLQNQFADIVKQIDKQKIEIQKSLEEIQKLQEGLINQYFRD